jgi:hypothetical protein
MPKENGADACMAHAMRNELTTSTLDTPHEAMLLFLQSHCFLRGLLQEEGRAMLFSILLIVLGIVCIAGVGRLIWHLMRGPDAQRRKALVTLLINRVISRGRATAGESPSSTARERRASKHAAWSQRQHTHSQAHHAQAHQGGFPSSHPAHSSGHHSSSPHGGFDSGGHIGGHH